jgi:phosphoglycerate dehydrogenase-like enzyme
MKNKIVSLAPLPIEVIESLLPGDGLDDITDIEVINANTMKENEIIDQIQEATVVIADFTFNIKITNPMISIAKHLKLIQNLSVGYQHIDINACTEAGIKVANTPGANDSGVAEHTIMLGLCLVKKLIYANKTTREMQWKFTDIAAGEISGKYWGLIGMGSTGRAVAKRLIPFGVNVIYFDINRLDSTIEAKYQIIYSKLKDLLKNADIVSLHCPLTETTKQMIGKKELALMKNTAVLINVSRGEVIDEQAVADALKNEKIAGAGLDVFSKEPIPAENPLLHVDTNNLILTPHIAGSTKESQLKIVGMAFNNIRNILTGKEPDYLVN